MSSVDLNCDMGESFGAWTLGNDEAVLPHVTSANIACGFHAGDPGVMRQTVERAVANGVAIGAHPGLSDLAGFGRRELQVTPSEAYDLVVYQIGALLGFVRAAGTTLRHVKPHGALYNMAARDADLAYAIARAVRDAAPGARLFGLSGSHLLAAGERAGVPTASEVFADRGYAADSSLVPRGQPGAVIDDPDDAVRRALRMVNDGTVRAADGGDISVRADTICIHGDGARAAEFAHALRTGLEANGIIVQPID